MERVRLDGLLIVTSSESPLGRVLLDVPSNPDNPGVNRGQVRGGVLDTRG